MLLDLVPAAVALVLLLITMLSNRTAGIAVLWLHRQPIDTIGETYLFSMHMVQFLLLTFVAAPLLVLGVPGWMLRRLLEARRLAAAAHVATRPAVTLALFTPWC